MIELPHSKSIGARFMVATYFTGTLPADPFFEDNEDLMILQRALLEVYSDEEPIDYGDSPIDVGSSGTAMRFVTAVCASCPGADYVITGSPRLMQRPMTLLMNLLKEAGAEVEALGENGCGPYRVKGGKIKGGEFAIRGDVSSQFISAVMLVSPFWENGVKLNFSTELVSRPYIEMTAKLMEKFGIKVKLEDQYVEVEHGEYREPVEFEVEADWSSASFFYEACVLGTEGMELANLVAPSKSLQGDSEAEKIFGEIGVKSTFERKGAIVKYSGEKPEKIEVSFRDCPDLMLPFGVACMCSGIKFRFTGISHQRLKESDRVSSMVKESKKLGYVLRSGDDFLEWTGEVCEAEEEPLIETYDDHRIAMSFAPVAFKTGKIRISHPEVVEKSFIDFWNQIEKLGLSCKETGDVMEVKWKEL